VVLESGTVSLVLGKVEDATFQLVVFADQHAVLEPQSLELSVAPRVLATHPTDGCINRTAARSSRQVSSPSTPATQLS
jgi:hypothetical protein